ncbi:unnamed protein product [Amoebophrya sp. A120]|nr:unnamed protein product [Amoebophrya sp. A120]|eukprot:GSA120T00000001001.1
MGGGAVVVHFHRRLRLSRRHRRKWAEVGGLVEPERYKQARLVVAAS